MAMSDISSLLTASSESDEDIRRISNEKTLTAKDSLEKEISQDENYNKMKLNKKFLRENTREKDGSNETISKKVIAKAKRENKATSREDTMKEEIPKQPLRVYTKRIGIRNDLSKNVWEKNVSKDEVSEEENKVPTTLEQSSDKTPLMWACQAHELKKVRRLLRDHADDTIQTTLGETALILAIPTVTQRLSKNSRKILELLCRNPVNWSHQHRNRIEEVDDMLGR